MPGKYVCSNCGNDDAAKLVLKDNGRSLYCAVCRHLTDIPADPNELRGTIRIDDTELENAIRNADAQILLENYEAAVTQMGPIVYKFGYAPEAWYYLARAETKDFTVENEHGRKHLQSAKRVCEKDPSQAQIQNMISAAERKMSRIPELKKYRDTIASLEAEVRSLESECRSIEEVISQKEADLEEKNKKAAEDTYPGAGRKLSRNRLRRLIQAIFAVCLFVLLPWTRDFWNKHLPEQFRITFLPNLADSIRKALDNNIPESTASFLGIGFAVLCALLLFFALRSKKAADLKDQKKASAEHRKAASVKAADLEKTIRDKRREIESKKRMIEEKKRLIEEQKQTVEAILAQP